MRKRKREDGKEKKERRGGERAKRMAEQVREMNSDFRSYLYYIIVGGFCAREATRLSTSSIASPGQAKKAPQTTRKTRFTRITTRYARPYHARVQRARELACDLANNPLRVRRSEQDRRINDESSRWYASRSRRVSARATGCKKL